ncbi:MAG TPA: hypothetical protein VJZ69_04665, partial [Clostridia bacterium]|nr:hypothetical protein [Clostridia bacterium]
MNSKTKKILLIVADVVLYLIGFPALLVIGYLASREFIAQGIYGIMAYVPIILAGLVMVVCGIVEIFFRASSKRTFAEGRKHRSNFKKQTLRMVITVVTCLCGLMLVLDFALPGVLKDATQGTILYDDIVENYSDQNLAQRKLVDTFIELNVENGYLTEKAYKVIDKAVEDGTLTGNTAASFKTTFDNLSKEFRGGTYMYPEEISTTSAWDSAIFAPIKDKKVDVLREYKAEAFENAEVKPLAKSIFYSIDAAYAAFDPLLIEIAQVDMNLVMASPDLIGKVLLAYVSDGQIRTKIVNGEKLTAVNVGQISQNATALENAELDPEDEFL